MPREVCYQRFCCEIQIDHDSRKYSTSGSLLLRIFLAVNSGSRVGLKDSICGACRRRYDRWKLTV